jgi:hypothetical protein
MNKIEKIQEMAEGLPTSEIDKLLEQLNLLKQVRKSTHTRVKARVVLASNSIHPACKS